MSTNPEINIFKDSEGNLHVETKGISCYDHGAVNKFANEVLYPDVAPDGSIDVDPEDSLPLYTVPIALTDVAFENSVLRISYMVCPLTLSALQSLYVNKTNGALTEKEVFDVLMTAVHEYMKANHGLELKTATVLNHDLVELSGVYAYICNVIDTLDKATCERIGCAYTSKEKDVEACENGTCAGNSSVENKITLVITPEDRVRLTDTYRKLTESIVSLNAELTSLGIIS